MLKKKLLTISLALAMSSAMALPALPISIPAMPTNPVSAVIAAKSLVDSLGTITKKVNGKTNFTPVFSEYWCGPDSGCSGQSSDFSDMNPKATHVFVAFALTDGNGQASFQLNQNISQQTFIGEVQQLQHQAVPKKVVLSVGGQGADWSGALNNPANFVSSIFSIINAYGFDGVDLDIESASLGSAQQAKQLIVLIKALRQQFNTVTNKHLLITVSPECTTVVNTVPVVGGGWNTMVPVVDLALNDIDFIQVQEYNDNPYGDTPGTMTYLEHIYNSWITPFSISDPVNGISQYNGMPANKLVMGVPASPIAANSQFYADPQKVLTPVIADLKSKYATPGFGGIMTWDSHWDQLNNYAVSNAVVNTLFQKAYTTDIIQALGNTKAGK